MKYLGKGLLFLTIPKPPCPLVPCMAGGSNSTRFSKKIIHPAFPSLRAVGATIRKPACKPCGLEAEPEADKQVFANETPNLLKY